MPHHPCASPASPASPAVKTWGAVNGKPLRDMPSVIMAPAGALVGQTLTLNPGIWRGKTPITLTYQWTRDGANIAGATAITYVLVAADKSHVIGCVTTATNSVGATTGASKNTHYPAN